MDVDGVHVWVICLTQAAVYWISLMGCYGYYFLCLFFVLVVFVGGYNLRVACSPKKLINMNDGDMYKQCSDCILLDIVSSTHSLSVLLSAIEAGCTTQMC